jgi:hypothetical protein
MGGIVIDKKKIQQKDIKTIIVLGAGASFGSEYANPPLINNFFEKANELGITKKREFNPLWKFIKDNFGLDLRQILSQEKNGYVNIEQIYSLTSALGEDEIQKLLEKLLHWTLTETTKVYKNQSCSYHDIILKYINPNTIISFNYDLIIDKSLATIYRDWESGQIEKFDKIYDGRDFIDSNEFLKSYKKKNNGRFPLLYKLHGSLNQYYDIRKFEQTRSRERWINITTEYIVPLTYAFDTQRIYRYRPLRDYAPSTLMTSPGLYDAQRADLKLNLTPPIYNKTPQDWDEILQELKTAGKIVFIGYSLADIDLWAIRLFRRGYQKHRHKNDLIVEVVNPDKKKDVVSKIKSIYYDSNVTKVANTIKEYAEKLAR